MKLTVLQEDLSKALTIALRFTSSKIQLPILSNIYCKASKNSLLLCATNLEISVCLTIGAEIIEEGEITVPAKTITDIITNLSKGKITLTCEEDTVHISAKGFSSLVTGMPASDFPAVPKELGTDALTIPTKDFVSAISSVLFSVSIDESRPILTGVLCILEENMISLVSTDGFRLSRKNIEVTSNHDTRIIIPKSILQEITRLKEEHAEISFSYTKEENQVNIKIGNAIISSRLIDGEFPNFTKIIPKETSLSITVGTSQFQKALKIAEVFARDSANVVKMKISKGEDDSFALHIFAESPQKGNQEMEVEAEIQDKGVVSSTKREFVIAFNVKFLEDFVSSIGSDELKIDANDMSSPVIFSDMNDSHFLHIIMPIKL